MTKEELQQLEIRCPSEEIKKQVQANWDAVAKPLDGLGAFEALTAKLGAALGTADFDLTKKAVIVMCADNGIVAEGVSQSGQEVTAAVAASMGKQASSVGKMAKSIGADVFPVDIGINSTEKIDGVLDQKIRSGTRDFLMEPAMTEAETLAAIEVGWSLCVASKRRDIPCSRPEKWGSEIPRQAVRWRRRSPAVQWRRSPAEARG